MSYPENYLYTKEHEWLKVEGNVAKVGITQYAVEQLGDVVHLELPEAGATFGAGESFGTVESTKTVSDLYLPAAGKIVKAYEELLDAPEKVAESPHDEAWLIEVELDEKPEGLMTSAEYVAYLEQSEE